MEFKFAVYFVGLVSAVFVPLVSQFLKTQSMSRIVKFLITVGLSIGTGVAGYFVSGYPLNDLVLAITGSLTLAISAYELFWKKVFEDSVVSRLFKFRAHAKVVSDGKEMETEIAKEKAIVVKKAEVKKSEIKKVNKNKKK